MRYALASSAALLFGLSLLQPASAQGVTDLVQQAVAAQGGADALRKLKALAIKGEAKHWDPSQSYTAGGEPRFLGDSTITVAWDLVTGMARTDWDRDMKYPFPELLKYSEIISPAFGVITDQKGSRPMPDTWVASHLRELRRAVPTLLLRAAEASQNIAALEDQKLGTQSLPAISFTDGGTKFIILFDRTSHLPAAIRTRDDDGIYGDSNYDLILADWKSVGGVKIAHALSYRLNGMEVQRLTYKEVAANPAIAADTFAVSDEVKAKAQAPASDAPYQWVLRRVFLARPAGGSLKLSELSPDVQQVVGGTHNSLIVAMKDGLVVFDAPISEAYSRWVIDAAKAKYPDKAIKYLVLTHHHLDHVNGMRTYVAEGVTVIVPTPDKAYFERVVKAAHTVAPDALQKQMRPANIVEVKQEISLKDDTTEIRLYNIPNPHVEGMIIGHVVKDNVVWVTDIWSPGRDAARTLGTLALNDAVKKFGIKDATFAGGHGSTAKQSVLDGIVAHD